MTNIFGGVLLLPLWVVMRLVMNLVGLPTKFTATAVAIRATVIAHKDHTGAADISHRIGYG